MLLLLLPFGSASVALHHSVMAFQADSTVLLGEWKQLPALGYERPDLQGKAKLDATLP